MAFSGAVPKAILKGLKRRVRLEKRSFWLVEGWSKKGGPLAALVGYPYGWSELVEGLLPRPTSVPVTSNK